MDLPNPNSYTGRFNWRHKLFGHLFSGRYKSLIVDGSGNGYLKQCAITCIQIRYGRG